MFVNRALLCAVLATGLCFFAAVAQTETQPSEDLLATLRQIAERSHDAPRDLTQSVITQIERDPAAASKTLLPVLRDSQISDEQMQIYLWAAGLTNNPDFVAPIIAIAQARGPQSTDVKLACAAALSELGGPQAGAFVMSQLESATDDEARFVFLNMLAQMQYEPVLPKALEVLKVDPDQLYWQPMFIFGKLGDIAIPALIKELDSTDRNVRINAAMILGRWLMAPEAGPALQHRFHNEDDTEVRMHIFAALEGTMTTPTDLVPFVTNIAANDKDERIRSFAQGALAALSKLDEQLRTFTDHKKNDAAEFRTEYDQLYKSCGKDGTISMLGIYAQPSDIPKLKDLRRRILRRNSDECFYDYEEVNHIILFNRLLAASPTSQPTSAPSAP